jgi:hypothetical protein
MPSLRRKPYHSIGALPINMFDLAYILLTGFFFLLCWAFTKACDRL